MGRGNNNKWSNQNKSHRGSNKNFGRGRGRGRGGGSRHNDRNVVPDRKFTPRSEDWKTMVSLNEKELGITEYIGTSAEFSGIIKSRYSDFHVNEIDMDGNLVELTDKSIPVPDMTEEKSKKLESENELISQKLITKEQYDAIETLVDSNETKEETTVEIDVTDLDKTQRTLIHNTLKSIFETSIVTSTLDRDERKLIKIGKFSKGSTHDRREKWLWPHEYTYFVLHKENVDTMQAALILSQNLGCKPESLAYAGTKDKRAKTSQLFCIKKRHPQKLKNAVSRVPNIEIGNFSFKPTTLKLGQLTGNKFKIALRNVVAGDELIEESLNSFKNNGFINYYGLQRFGNCASIPTYSVGKELLTGKWNEAVELIMKPRDGEPKFMKDMRDFWWKTRDASGALDMLRAGNRSVEAKLLYGLQSHDKTDYVNALANIPRNMRLLYIHSYQSLVWNQVVSRRIKEFGLKLQKGDLVFVDKVENVENLIASDEREPIKTDEEEEEEAESTDEVKEEISSFKAMVKPLTDEEIESGKYTIYDLVLPLPGHDITYPSNVTQEWYEEILAKDDLSSEKLKQTVKAYSLTGSYRKAFVMPKNFNWSIKKYSSPSDTLILSDIEKFKNNQEEVKATDGKLKALILEFDLPSSTYATMALREILKIDTSSSSQIKLSESLINKKKEEEEEEVAAAAITDDPKEEVNAKGEKRQESFDEGSDAKKIKIDLE